MPVLPKFIADDLSTDQKYLYNIIHDVQRGSCSALLANKKPGPINHARFLTLGCRILRLYVATEKPSKKLEIMAHFVVRVYGPMWFTIKMYSDISHGPRNLFKFIEWIEWMPQNLKNLMRNVASRNAYFSHSENLLL